MSGGFFRGTSADQDTRFSNKQAKLMKSQKFPSELEHLVNISKVKMDVMKPWIAQRVTELLGFEDEVLINFIYGLLDGKAVNGKEVQISLTGFMEKNTGKFMKELWQLLLSAQNNATGVPQQFLDAKEEETRQKQVETDRIKGEMQKKKEKEDREFEEEKRKKLDGEAGMKRTATASLEPSSKRRSEASHDKEMRNGARGRNRVSRSPHSPGDVSLSPRSRRSRSMSKSFSSTRSYSEERLKSRGLSRSPTSRKRSVSAERGNHSHLKRSVSPRRKYSPPRSVSPPIRRSSYSRRRSTSRSRQTSPSPIRRRMRSPIRRRSRTPVRRRSRSPPRYRSRSPVRRRYPSSPRRRSPSPVRRRHRRSPTPPPRSPSPIKRRSPIRRRSRTPPRYRSRSKDALSSPSPVRRLSPSVVKRRSPRRQRSPVRSPRERTSRAFEKLSPVHHARNRGSGEDSDDSHEGPGSAVQRPSVSLRSPQRDTRVLENSHRKSASSSPSPQKLDIPSKLLVNARRRSPSEDRRSHSPDMKRAVQAKTRKVRDDSLSPPQNSRDHRPRHGSQDPISKKGEFDRARNNGNQKLNPSEKSGTSSKPETRKDVALIGSKRDYSPERSVGRRQSETGNRSDGLELRKEPENRSVKALTKVVPSEDYKKEVPAIYKDSQKADEKIPPLLDEAKHKSAVKVDEKSGSGSLSSGSDDSLKRHSRKGHEYRKQRRSRKAEAMSDDSIDSEIEDRKVAKRRKKEEKRSRKEEKRRRREERHRRREERRAEKLKTKSNDGSDAEETVTDQKKLEIELREKALESLRAKKGAGH